MELEPDVWMKLIERVTNLAEGTALPPHNRPPAQGAVGAPRPNRPFGGGLRSREVTEARMQKLERK